MKQLFRTIVFLSIGCLSACSIFQKDSFEGDWTLKLSGAIQETFNFQISPTNEFSFSQLVSYGGRDYDVSIKGKIGNDGKIKADIMAEGQIMGDLVGMMTYENGNGKWGASILSGVWTATKK